jgi:PAS domain S-box-containing protein
MMDVNLNGNDQNKPSSSHADGSKYFSLFEQATDAIMLTDFEGNFIDANESFCSMFGYAKEDIPQLHVSSLIHPEDISTNPIRFDLLKNGKHVFTERRMVHRNGMIVFVEANVKKCDDECVLAIARDVTERKFAKDSLEKEKALSDSIINTLPGIFFLRYEPGNNIRWNKNLESVLGYSPEEIATLPILSLIAEEDRNRLRAKIAEAMQTGSIEAEACVVKKNGEKVPYYFTALSLTYEGKPCIMGSAIDISPRIKAEKLLEEEKMKRQQEVTEAVINAAENERQAIGRELHDNINQLLAGSLMYTRLYQATLNKADPLLDESAKQVMNAITEIRGLSHSLISPFLQEQPFKEALEKIVLVLRKSGIEDVQIDLGKFEERRISPKLKITLFRIIQEQFNNILRHSKAKKVSLAIKHERQKLSLCIKDNGIGFDATLKSEGIGLINIKTRASLFNGITKMISSPGKGCELKVEFN